MKHYLSCLVFLSVFLLGSGCGGPEDITQASGDFAEEMAGPLCERMAVCGFFPGNQIDDCVDGFVTGYCETGCSDTITIDADEWSDCLNAYENHSCVSLSDLIMPSECLTIEEF
jgi:hypothetical protein